MDLDSESNPSLLILSATSTKPKSLIKLITKSGEIDEESSGVVKYNWTIDTKYYTAIIDVIGLDKDIERPEHFNCDVEAVIIHLDTNKESGLDDLAIWNNLTTDCDPEIKVLIANCCDNETKISKSQVTKWCLKENFEFVELYPSNIDMEDTYDDLCVPEKIGVERVIEILDSHTWSNLIFKQRNSKSPVVETDEEKDSNQEKNAIGKEKVTGEDPLDNLTELFSQVRTMRESLNSLPSNQRKQCAEQMVTAFWKAIGGDDEEISDL